MNFSQSAVRRKISSCGTGSLIPKLWNSVLLILLRGMFFMLVIGVFMAAAFAFGVFRGIVDNAPEIEASSISPLGYATTIYDAAGNETTTLVMAGSNREEAVWEEIPEDLVNAFVAIEDARFWQHNGIDTRSIMRAVAGVVKGDSSSGGGSTITQQLIKNNVFNGGREKTFGEKLERKFQEQYLALELEKQMDKRVILTNYLNTINLGNNALGIKVAARRYFNKDVSDLTLSECTVIAGITQNPSRLNPISGRENNEDKRKIILRYMLEQGYITKEEMDEALADNVYDRIQNVDIITKEKASQIYSYFTDELINQVMTDFQEKYGYTETQAHNMLYGGGLKIYTTQDPYLQEIVDREINDPENYPVTRYGLEYRLSIKEKDDTTVNYSEGHVKLWHRSTKNEEFDGLYPSEEAALKDAEDFREAMLEKGGTVLGEASEAILEPQDSFVLMEQETGRVVALSGGRGRKKTSLSLNRASGTLRQPGSTFKVLSAFAPAIDSCGATLATVYYDEPYTLGTKSFRNWYGNRGYLGWSSIREGIVYSMNIVALRCLVETVSPQLGVEYCRKFGISTLTDSDFNAALALGGITNGVSNLELTAAYAAIANGGVYTKPVFYTKIIDHNGKVLIDNTPETHRVLKDSTAFLLTDAMEDVMVSNRKFARDGVSLNSTSPRAKVDGMSCAGKSGTTSNSVDVWFVGYTPYYTAGIWAGCDNNQVLTDNGGASFHKDLWKVIMTQVHEGLSDPGFSVPDSVETATVCRKSGKLPLPGVCSGDPRGNATYTEYFAKGTVPTEFCDHHSSVTVCAETYQLPSLYCTMFANRTIMVIPDDSEETDDSVFAYPGHCELHMLPPDPALLQEQTEIVQEGEPETGLTYPVGPGYQTIDPEDNVIYYSGDTTYVDSGPGAVQPQQ